jgi:hypothetical protein
MLLLVLVLLFLLGGLGGGYYAHTNYGARPASAACSVL